MTLRCGTALFLAVAVALLAWPLRAQKADAPATPMVRTADARVLDRQVIAEGKKAPEVMANLTHLCDFIGPRLTGSARLRRANEWAAERMKAYGLANVHQEAWSLPEGWERGSAQARLIDPDNGRALSVASWGWRPGTRGKVQCDVVFLEAKNKEELAAYRGKLKGAAVLASAPSQLVPIEEIEKPSENVAMASRPAGLPRRVPRDQLRAFYKEREDFLDREGAAAMLLDAGKHFGLLVTTGGWEGDDRPSAIHRVPILAVAHNHYQLLHRLAARSASSRPRLEIEVENRFVPGPIPVWNTVGEIKGTDKADEVVVVGAHLDSWDLGQGATDNGTGAVVVLEAARVLARCGVKPRRTIRFILFSGEEQGLHGSKAYVEKHKDEMARVSACLIHDTGTGRVIGLRARHRPALEPILETELASLAELGVTDFHAAYINGSDHASFEKAGVPGLMCSQATAGYPLNHHTQADTLDRAIEADLVQSAQVMAVAALRIANRDQPLPRDKGTRAAGRRFQVDDLDRLIRMSAPQVCPDGKSVVVVVSRPNLDKNRFDSELVLVDVAGGKQRVLTYERHGHGQPRWSPSGDRLAFLAISGSGKDAQHQVYVLPMNGGDARRVTDAPRGVLHFAWRPDGADIAYAAEDEPVNKKEIEKHLDAFEVGNDDFLTTAAPVPAHVWLVSAEGGTAKRLTSGKWGLASVPPPGPPSSPLSWSPDGKSLLIVRQERPNTGDNDLTSIQVIDVATGKLRPLTGRERLELVPSFSPDGSQVAYWYPRDGDPNNVLEVWSAPATGGKGRCLTRPLDRCLFLSQWLPDGKGLLVGGHDATRVALWHQPLDGPAHRLDLGSISPSWLYQMDAHVGRTGAVAFTGSESARPTELYFLDSITAKPRRLTDFNREVAGRDLGKVEAITWQGPDGFAEDGVLVYPPDFAPTRKYPLVLVIHGGPQSASTETFSPLPQVLAARGHIVFSPNYRGSDNLGNAYQRAIVKDWGEGPGRDVMAGLEAVIKRGFVDETRIAVTGWSYGGYMTSWLIGHYHVWKTAIAGAAVTDWIDEYTLSDGNVQTRDCFGGSPWVGDLAKFYKEQSPITYAGACRTPTLILATTGDARVPITQSYRLFHALKDNGVPVKFVAYPVSGHSPSDPVRYKDLFRRWADWLDERLP